MSPMADSIELLGPETPGQFRMIACPSISHERRTDRYFPAGRTIGDYLRELGWAPSRMSARVTIDGVLIPDAEWQTVIPQAGQAVIVRAIPQGGGKQAVQIAAMLALTVAAIYVGGAETGFLATKVLAGHAVTYGTLLGAGLLVGGSLALHGRIPAPLPRRALPRPMRELKEAA